MSRETRSKLMGRIRGKHTGPERAVADFFRSRRFKFDQHARDLPGSPDFVFRSRRVIILVDGDFWHGWRFSSWSHKLSPSWRAKIAANMARDLRNMRKLRRAGWTVMRIWEHQIDADPSGVLGRLLDVVRSAPVRRSPTSGR